MSPHHPIPIHLPADVFRTLTEFTGEHWFGDASSDALCNAVRHWITQHGTPTQPTPAMEKGYQWKQLFLPEGTCLRTSFRGQPSYAEVAGGMIVSGNKHLTPSQFANEYGCGNRNAWRVIWLRFPGEAVWQQAARLLQAGEHATPCHHIAARRSTTAGSTA